MFLVTTPDERYWKAEADILFLGDWCRLPQRREIWSRLRHEVLAYHWDDRSRFHRDYQYVRNLARRCLPELAAELNRLHGLSYSPRFWNIFLGAWLNDFVGICFDRYLSIRSAAESNKVDNVLVPPPGHRVTGSAAMSDFHVHYLSTAFNDRLFGFLIRKLRPFPFAELGGIDSRPDVDPRRAPNRVRTAATAAWGAVVRLAPSAAKKIALVSSSVSLCDLLRLDGELGQVAVGGEGGDCGDAKVSADPMRRGLLRMDLGEGEFERLLGELLQWHLPLSVVEEFAGLQGRARCHPASTRVVFSTNFLGTSDSIRLWAADRVERGGVLALHQHGGNIGSALCSAFEDHETEIADAYHSWGWTNSAAKNVRPLPSAKLVASTRRITVGKGNGILVNGDTVPLRFYRFASMPVGHQVMRLHEGYLRFFRELSPSALRVATLRLYPFDWGWREMDFYRQAMPGLRLYRGRMSFYDQLCRACLFVCGNNQTSYLETLAADFPTVLFLDPLLWEIREEARPYFEELKSAGICHENPVAAAELVSQICENPASWWRQSEVQAARRHFCERFARTDENWRKCWETELRSHLRSAFEPGADGHLTWERAAADKD